MLVIFTHSPLTKIIKGKFHFNFVPQHIHSVGNIYNQGKLTWPIQEQKNTERVSECTHIYFDL